MPFYSSDQIRDLFARLTPDPAWSFADCTTKDTTRLTHGYHRYPAKFIPQLVDKLLDEYVRDVPRPVVNDLFMGSGTTIVCAIERGYAATGTDINPVAHLITRAKATPLEPEALDRAMEALTKDLARSRKRAYVPASDRLDYWFAPETKRELGQILAHLRAVNDAAVQTFLLCCFSHILKPCSIWLRGSTKPTRARAKTPAQPIPTFLAHLRKMAARNRAFWETVPQHTRENIGEYLDVRCQDARQQPCADNSVDIQITSSPYVTSYEYADLHQLTALWLEYADDLKEFRARFIGTGQPKATADGRQPTAVSGQRSAVTQRLSSAIGREVVAQLQDKDAGLARAVEAFFADMHACFAETYRILKPGGRAGYVIGNTTLKGVAILNAQVFAETMQAVGLEIERVVEREIPSKILPQTRDPVTGRFARPSANHVHAYPVEYIVVGRKKPSQKSPEPVTTQPHLSPHPTSPPAPLLT